jgi:hypothetical protein
MARRLLATVLLALLPAACGSTDDGELTVQGVLTPGEFPDCENDGSCPEPLFCAQLVNLRGVERSPPLCLGDDICQRVTCDRGQCRITQAFPFQVRCVVD